MGLGGWPYPLGSLDPDPANVYQIMMYAYQIIRSTRSSPISTHLSLLSSIIQTRAYKRTPEGKRAAIKYGFIDSTFSLLCAFLINAAILIVSAGAFYYNDVAKRDVASIEDAYKLLSPSLGAKAASTLFAVALLASGQNSTITGTLAGQIVMEGFLQIKLKPWIRRIVT